MTITLGLLRLGSRSTLTMNSIFKKDKYGIVLGQIYIDTLRSSIELAIRSCFFPDSFALMVSQPNEQIAVIL